MDNNKRRKIKKIVRHLVQCTTLEERQDDIKDMWFNFKPTKEEIAEYTKPYNVFVLYDKEFKLHEIKYHCLTSSFGMILNEVFAINDTKLVYQIWNDYRQCMLYRCHQRMKRKDRRKKKNHIKQLHNYYMLD